MNRSRSCKNILIRFFNVCPGKSCMILTDLARRVTMPRPGEGTLGFSPTLTEHVSPKHVGFSLFFIASVKLQGT